MANLFIGIGDRIKEGDPNVFKIACTIGEEYVPNKYVDLDSPMNVISLPLYNKIFAQKFDYKGFNFVGIGREVQLILEDLFTK